MGAEGIRSELQVALSLAMKDRDRIAVTALRSALAAVANAEAVPGIAPSGGSEPIAGAVSGVGAAEVARRELDEAEVAGVIEGEIVERVTAAEGYEVRGHPEEAARLRREIEVLRSCLG